MIGAVNLPSHGIAAVTVATVATVVTVVVGFVEHALLPLSNWQALSALHSLGDNLEHGSGLFVVVVVVLVVVCTAEHALLPLSNWQAPSALHSLGDNLEHGSGLFVVVVVVLVVLGTEQTEAAASNAHPVAKQAFFLSPVHGLNSEHCFTPSTAPKVQPATALHFFRFSPSQTLPLPSALLHVLVGLSNAQPSVFLHIFPLRPLQVLKVIFLNNHPISEKD